MTLPVRVDISDGVALLTLNQPEKRNAMTLALMEAFSAAVTELADNSSVHAVVITGEGSAFCAGADFRATAELAAQSGAAGATAAHYAIRKLYGAFLTVERLPQPTIAAVNGAAIGGGLGLALLCDVRIVGDTAKLAVNFARLGIHPGLGISALLPELVGYERAARMLLTGDSITGVDAVAFGLASESVAPGDVVSTAMALARRMASAAPLSIRAIKRTLRSLRSSRGSELESVLELESLAQATLSQTDDAREGVMALMQKRAPKFRGS